MTNETDSNPWPASKLLELLRAENVTLLRDGKALADLIGMSQSHLDKLLSGERSAGTQSLKKIAAYFARVHHEQSEPTLAAAPPLSRLAGPGDSTMRVVELSAVEQRQYIAAMLEASGIPQGIASYVGLHVELEGKSSPAEGLRAAKELAQSMLEEEAAEAAASAPEEPSR